MGTNAKPGQFGAADALTTRIKEYSKLLQWDRDVNAKLYYGLWVVFMGGFVLSLNSSVLSTPPSECMIWLVRLFRCLAVVGSALNFLLQSNAINGSRHLNELGIEYAYHLSLVGEMRAYDTSGTQKPQSLIDEANEAHKESAALADKLGAEDSTNSRLELCLKWCAVLFFVSALVITWNIFPAMAK
jgi:hypothetical protein